MPLFGPPDIDKLLAKGDVKGLVKALSHEWPQKRHEAAVALGQLGSAGTVESLASRMEGIAPGAARALRGADSTAARAVASHAIDLLIAALRDPSDHVQQGAVWALGRLGDARAIPHLIAGLSDSLWMIRERAAEGLGNLRDPSAVVPLVGALADAESEVRRAAEDALVKLGAASVDALAARLVDEDDEMRSRAARVLEKLGWEPDSDAERARYAVARKSWDEALSIGAASVEPLILTAVSGTDWEARVSAVELLGTLGDPRAVEPLITIVTEETGGEVRKEAVIALAKLGDPRAVKALTVPLGADDEETRQVAAVALGKFVPSDKVESLAREATTSALIATLRDPESRLSRGVSAYPGWVRARKLEAAEALGEVGGTRAVDALVDALEDEDTGVRQMVVRALARQKDPSLGSLFGKVFSDEDSGVGDAAAEALVSIGQPAVDILIPYLHSERWGLRRRAVDALKAIGGDEAHRALAELRQTEQDSVILGLLAN